MEHRVLLEVVMKLVFAIVLLPARMVIAVDYVVGGTAGWGFVPTASFYSDWAAETSFVPGDRLSKTHLHFKVSPLKSLRSMT